MSDQAATAPVVWEPPDGDEEFVFEDIGSAPGWVDKGWASYNQGPALALPAGDVYGSPPYTTITARVGDTVKYVAPTPSRPGHFEVIPGEPVGEAATKKPPQQSAASLEDMLKTGVMTPDDLGPDAKAQVTARSPQLKGLVEEGKAAPDPIPVSDLVKTS
jgi:hypothetical protein